MAILSALNNSKTEMMNCKQLYVECEKCLLKTRYEREEVMSWAIKNARNRDEQIPSDLKEIVDLVHRYNEQHDKFSIKSFSSLKQILNFNDNEIEELFNNLGAIFGNIDGRKLIERAVNYYLAYCKEFYTEVSAAGWKDSKKLDIIIFKWLENSFSSAIDAALCLTEENLQKSHQNSVELTSKTLSIHKDEILILPDVVKQYPFEQLSEVFQMRLGISLEERASLTPSKSETATSIPIFCCVWEETLAEFFLMGLIEAMQNYQ